MKIDYKSIKRYKEILRVLVKYGFTFVVEKLNIGNLSYKDTITPVSDKIRNMSTGEKIRRAMEELGPTFVKLGQILSSRTDLLEPEIIEELSKLRYNVEVFDTELAKQIFYNQTNKRIEDVFEYFNEIPIAGASIGQVYECRLKTGEEVVLKIQRPNIEETIKSDINILRKMSEIKTEISIDFTKILEEFNSQLMRELDYNFEAMNATKFKEMFKENPNVHIPRVYNEYTTKKTLVMEKVIGIKLDNKARLKELNWDTENISRIGMKAFFRQVLEHGFFHADLHPGNIFVVSRDCISYIDFGMVGIIDSVMLSNINSLGLAIVQKDIDKIIYILDDMNILNKDIDKSSLKHDILYMIHYYYDTKIEELNISDIVNDIFSFLRKHKMELPYELSILAKTIITLEGTARELNPNFSIKSIVGEFTKDYYEYRLDKDRLIKESMKNIQSIGFELKYLPKHINKTLKKFDTGNLRVEVEDINTNKLEKKLVESSNRVSMSLISAGLFIGSSLMMYSSNIKETPVIQIIFAIQFIVATLLAIIVIIDICKSRK